jgi:hypothetical protein
VRKSREKKPTGRPTSLDAPFFLYGGTMSVFDQRGQKVNYQYNVNGVINFGNVQNKMEVVSELEKLQTEVTKAAESGDLDQEISADVEAKLKKAVIQAQKPETDKKTILDYLGEAKSLLVNIASVAGLVKGISEAIETVRKFF